MRYCIPAGTEYQILMYSEDDYEEIDGEWFPLGEYWGEPEAATRPAILTDEDRSPMYEDEDHFAFEVEYALGPGWGAGYADPQEATFRVLKTFVQVTP
jgi:hypothetical protein